MFNTNRFFLNRFQSKFQGTRRLRFSTNRFSKAESLDSIRGEQFDQKSNQFDSQRQTRVSTRFDAEDDFESGATRWSNAGNTHTREGKIWSRSLKHFGFARDTVEIKGSNDDGFMKSSKASRSLRQGFGKEDSQEQQDAFKRHFFMRSKANGTETETEAELATGIDRGTIVDHFAWGNESNNAIAASALRRANPQPNHFNWQHNFGRDLNIGGLFGSMRIFDASGDASKKEVFEDGALEISYNKNYLSSLKNTHAPEFNLWGMEFNLPGWVSATVSATKSSTGEVVDLGSTTLNLDQGSFYVNLKDQLEASDNLFDRRSTWNIDVDIDATYTNGLSVNLEDFNENITMIDALDLGSGYQGDVTANTFTYQNYTSGFLGDSYDSGRIYRGRGGTDTLVLDGIQKSDILEFNGSSVNQLGESAAGGAALGEQAFYGGTVFDVLNLNNGDELYLQGIEKISCEDGDIRVRANMSNSTKDQWNLQAMDVSGAWRFNRGSSNVVLVSLDNGIGDIAGNASDIHDEISHVNNKTAKNNRNLRHHGHQAMSVMSAKHDSQNLAGIAPGSELWAYNVYDSGTQLYDAIEGAKADRECDQRLVFQGGIQGNWWTNGSTQAEMQTAIDETEDYGFFAMAAGNFGNKTSVSGIAQAETTNGNVASIGALKHSGAINDVDGITNYDNHELADYSNAGANLTLVAPTDSPSINGDGDITDFGGTSCANPNVAGVAALVWSENTSLSGSEVRDLLTHSAMDLGDFGRDNTFGHGLVNAEAAVRRSHALDENYELASFYTNDQFLA